MFNCDFHRKFATMIGTLALLSGLYGAVSGGLVSSDPSTGYELSPDKVLYKLHTEELTWSYASRVCALEGAHLAVVNSEAESDFMKKLLIRDFPKLEFPVALVGFSDQGSQGQLKTVLGMPLEETGFTRWSTTQPGGVRIMGNTCGALHIDGGLGRFSCKQNAPFLCEKEVDKSGITSNTITTTTTAITTTTKAATTTPKTTTASMSSTSATPLPGSGYQLQSGLGWYKLHGEGRKWHEAERVCKEEGAHLAILNSKAEADALKRMMSRSRGINFGPCNCAFIGFHDLSAEGHFITVLGEPLESTGFLVWGWGNPDNTGNNEDCGAITYRGDLNDLSCDHKYPFICEHSTSTVSPNKSISEQGPPVYEVFPNVGSYKLHTDAKRWHEALEICAKEGANLAIVNSDAESDVLRKMIGRNPDLDLGDTKTAFLGFHDMSKEGNFTTVFGNPLSSTGFEKWAPNSPDNSKGAEDCGGITRNGRLNDVPCFAKAPFFCERPLGNDSKTNLPIIIPQETDPAQQPDYELLPTGGYYKLHTVVATWHEAKLKCEGEMAHLAIINSEEESHALRDLLTRYPHIDFQLYNSILLGFHDLTLEGHFVTIFGEPLESTGYMKWAPWQPDNFGQSEDCGAMTYMGFLNDVPCDLKLPYLCERGLTSNHVAPRRRMTITPDHVHVRQGSQVSIMCQSNEPLIECQFKVANQPLYDLSQGANTRADLSMLNDEVALYRYNGTGLANGQCGIVLTLGSGLHRKMVGCRGRALHGGWMYDYMSLHASNSPAIDQIKTPPRELFTNVGDKVQLLWQAKIPLTGCKCILPGMWTETVFTDSTVEALMSEEDSSQEDDLFFGNERPSVTVVNSSVPHYYGQGFKKGQCGVEVAHSDWNGYVWCGLASAPLWEWRSVAVIAAKPPTAPVLKVNAAEHSEGAILQAECKVSGSRPVANITWYLGDDVIRRDDVDDLPEESWTWSSDEQTITQRLTRQLKLGDHGRKLTCEAGHMTLPSKTLRTTRVITVEGFMLNRTFNVEEYGFEVDKPGFITVVITASPKPSIVWHFDNVTIKEGEQDASGRFDASQAVKVNPLGIEWAAKLFISKVTEEDFKRDFYLTSMNEFGAQAYKIVISKSESSQATPPKPVTKGIITQKTTTTTTASTSKSTATFTTEAPTTFPDIETTVIEETTTFDPTSTNDSNIHVKQKELTEKIAVKIGGWKTSGAIAGIVIAILLLHVSLAAILIYGRRSGWWCTQRKTLRGHVAHSVSMDNLVNQEEDGH